MQLRLRNLTRELASGRLGLEVVSGSTSSCSTFRNLITAFVTGVRVFAAWIAAKDYLLSKERILTVNETIKTARQYTTNITRLRQSVSKLDYCTQWVSPRMERVSSRYHVLCVRWLQALLPVGLYRDWPRRVCMCRALQSAALNKLIHSFQAQTPLLLPGVLQQSRTVSSSLHPAVHACAGLLSHCAQPTLWCRSSH